jgi:hypothetical protein
MEAAMSVTGAVGLIAGISLLMTPLPHLFVVYGSRLRDKSKYAF